jgi:site-specific DNA-methyltransferase (adenine-specific)
MTEPYFSDGSVSLYLGDMAEVYQWQLADVLVTDPPYGLDYRQRLGGYQNNPRVSSGAERGAPIIGDRTTAARDRALELWGDRPALVFGSWRMPRPEGVRQLLIWHKSGMMPGPANSAFLTNHEEVYVIGEGYRASAPPQYSVITTTEHRSMAVSQAGHPTPKPVGLMQLLLDRCPPGVIADPFAGSGSTLLAARNLGRRAIGVEIEERYCEQAAIRLGQQAFVFDELEG